MLNMFDVKPVPPTTTPNLHLSAFVQMTMTSTIPGHASTPTLRHLW